MADDYDEMEDEQDGEPDEEELEEELEEEEADNELEEEVGPNYNFVSPVLNAAKIKESPHKIIKIVRPEERITSEIIQLPELVEAIGIRCSEIENGSPVFCDYDGLNDPIDIAKKEFFDRKSPLLLQRQIGYDPITLVSTVEEWTVREMTFPSMQWTLEKK